MLKRLLHPTRHNEGYVLVWVIFCFLLFYLIAMSFADSSFLEGLISINHRQAAQAFEMADGGVLVGIEEIHTILEKDYSYSQNIPAELILSKQEWILNESGEELGFYLENPKCIYTGDKECRFQFTSRGVSPRAQRSLVAEVQVEFTVVYKLESNGDEEAVAVFDHREFIYPAKVVSLKYKDD
jgi:hypothetical protein